MASCLLISRRAYETVGPLDEARFPLFFNDVDWCLRAWKAGLKIFYTPGATIVHGGGASTNQVRASASGSRIGRSCAFMTSTTAAGRASGSAYSCAGHAGRVGRAPATGGRRLAPDRA
jgi:GT2 family glycosyltransferase